MSIVDYNLWTDIPNFKKDFHLQDSDYEYVRDFLLDRFKSLTDNCSLCSNSSYYLQTVNINIEDCYCCFSIYKNCFKMTRIDLPKRFRGKGFLSSLLESLEVLLIDIGIQSILFENILNESLFNYLINNNYKKLYLNFPRPNDNSLGISDAYKVLGESNV